MKSVMQRKVGTLPLWMIVFAGIAVFAAVFAKVLTYREPDVEAFGKCLKRASAASPEGSAEQRVALLGCHS